MGIWIGERVHDFTSAPETCLQTSPPQKWRNFTLHMVNAEKQKENTKFVSIFEISTMKTTCQLIFIFHFISPLTLKPYAHFLVVAYKFSCNLVELDEQEIKSVIRFSFLLIN